MTVFQRAAIIIIIYATTCNAITTTSTLFPDHSTTSSNPSSNPSSNYLPIRIDRAALKHWNFATWSCSD